MNKLFLSILALAVSAGCFSQNYQWAKSIGSAGDDRGLSIAVDASGNVYVTGHFMGTSDFDPGPGIQNHTAGGSRDIFFAKYDANGNYIWAKSIGCDGYGTDIALDNSANVYITGYFQDTADFDPGPGIQNLISSGSSWDVFFAKYDSSGNYIWAKNTGGPDIDDGLSISVDRWSNVYIAGTFFGDTADFDPGPGIQNLVGTSNYDIFIAKYDINGNYLWAKCMGNGGSQDVCNSNAVDNSGNLYITGKFGLTVDFDPGPGTQNLTAPGGGYNDIFIAKYDSSGNYLWAKNVGGTLNDVGRSIVVDNSGNLYVTGSFNDTADMDPGSGIQNLISAGGNDIVFAKYDTSGTYIWAKRIGGTSYDEGWGIAVDGSGGSGSGSNVYITGSFWYTADFDPGPGVQNLTATGGGYQIFFGKYDQNGNYVWAKPIGGGGTSNGQSITVDGSDNVYVTGYFDYTGDFDPGLGIHNLSSLGFIDIFFAKYSNSVTGVSEINFESDLKVYPNPTNGKLVVDADGILSVYNMIGEKVFEKKNIFKKTEIDLSDVPRGIYFVAIRDEKNNLLTKKIVKM